MTQIAEPSASIDLTGLRCPYLARRIRKALSRATVGQLVRFVCDDPLAPLDVAHLVTTLGHELVAQAESGRTLSFVVRRTDRNCTC